MSAIQRFFDWWQTLPQTHSALYPDPNADPKLKEYGQFLEELDQRWPKVRDAIFDALESESAALEKQAARVAAETLQWWEGVEREFIEKTYLALKNVRLNPNLLLYSVGSWFDNKGLYTKLSILPCSHEDIKLYVEVDEGEKFFAPGTYLRNVAGNWLENCREQLQDFQKKPLAKPLVAYLGYDGGKELPEVGLAYSFKTATPLQDVPVGGHFYAGSSSPAKFGEMTRMPPTSEPVYSAVFSRMREFFWNDMPPSVLVLHKTQAKSTWGIAHALDAFFSAKDHKEFEAALHWQYQINATYHVWFKSKAPALSKSLRNGHILLHTRAGMGGNAYTSWHIWRAKERILPSEHAAGMAVYFAFLLDRLSEWWRRTCETIEKHITLKDRTKHPRNWWHGKAQEALRNNPNLSDTALAKVVGVNQSTISRSPDVSQWRRALAHSPRKVAKDDHIRPILDDDGPMATS